MATSTLLPRTKPQRKPAGNHLPTFRQPPTLAPSRLQEAEDSLLKAAIERHPSRERGVAHLLNAIERPAAIDATTRRTLPTGKASSHQQIEDLIFEAVMRTHSNCNGAIDRLLGDVVGDAADLDDADGSCEVSTPEMPLSEMDEVDNDFDGMG